MRGGPEPKYAPNLRMILGYGPAAYLDLAG